MKDRKERTKKGRLNQEGGYRGRKGWKRGCRGKEGRKGGLNVEREEGMRVEKDRRKDERIEG